MPSLDPRRRLQPRRFHYEPRILKPQEGARAGRRLLPERAPTRPKARLLRLAAAAVALVVALYLYLHAEAFTEGVAAVGGALFGG
jgi:hypothetical protein